jgi:hypothetical protein
MAAASSGDGPSALVPLAIKAVSALEQQQEQLATGELDAATHRLPTLDPEFAPLLDVVPGLSKLVHIAEAPAAAAAQPSARSDRRTRAAAAPASKDEDAATGGAAPEEAASAKSTRRGGAAGAAAASSSSSSSSAPTISRVDLAALGGFLVFKEAYILMLQAQKHKASFLLNKPLTASDVDMDDYTSKIEHPFDFQTLKWLIDGLLKEPGPGGLDLANALKKVDPEVEAACKNPSAIPPSSAPAWQRIDGVGKVGELIKLTCDNCIDYNSESNADYAKGAKDLWEKVRPKVEDAVKREEEAVEKGRAASLNKAASGGAAVEEAKPAVRSRRSVGAAGGAGGAAAEKDEASSTVTGATGREEEAAAASEKPPAPAAAGKKRKRGEMESEAPTDAEAASVGVPEEPRRGKRHAGAAAAAVPEPPAAAPEPAAGRQKRGGR